MKNLIELVMSENDWNSQPFHEMPDYTLCLWHVHVCMYYIFMSYFVSYVRIKFYIRVWTVLNVCNSARERTNRIVCIVYLVSCFCVYDLWILEGLWQQSIFPPQRRTRQDQAELYQASNYLRNSVLVWPLSSTTLPRRYRVYGLVSIPILSQSLPSCTVQKKHTIQPVTTMLTISKKSHIFQVIIIWWWLPSGYFLLYSAWYSNWQWTISYPLGGIQHTHYANFKQLKPLRRHVLSY